ncbi:MAG: Ig-like domain-containing protein, partial [Pseudomonadota bacterium]
MFDDSELQGQLNAVTTASTISYSIATPPLHGSLTLTPQTTNQTSGFSYRPHRGFYGSDSFDVIASEGTRLGLPARISIIINPMFSDTDILPNLIPNCASDPTVNTCIIWKNPVGQTKTPMGAPITATSNLSALTIHGVNILPDWYDNSGFLKNTSIDVYANTIANVIARVSTTAGNFKFSYGNDPKHQFAQVMAFYWLNMQIKYMSQRVGNFFAKDKNIKVYAWDNSAGAADNAYYDSGAKDVHIG